MIPIDGSVDVLKDFEVPVTGSTVPEITVEEPAEDNLEELLLSLLLLADDVSELKEETLVEVGSADVSVKSVFLVKLADGESVTYDVEKELLTVLVAVVGVTVGMDDKTEEEDPATFVISRSSPLPPFPPSTTVLVAKVVVDDDP